MTRVGWVSLAVVAAALAGAAPAAATVGGPTLLDVLGWDPATERVYVHFVDTSGGDFFGDVVSFAPDSGAVGVSVDAAMLAAAIDRAIRFPPDVVFYTLDDRGQTALHRAGELIFAFPSEVGSATLGDAVKTMLSQPEGVVHYSYAGSDKTAVFARSPLTGWTYVLGKSHPAR